MKAGGIFDALVHAGGQSAQDLETLHYFGIRRVCFSPSPQPRRPTVERLFAAWDALFALATRARQEGLLAHVAPGLAPTELPDEGLHAALDALPRWLSRHWAVGLGGLGLRKNTPRERQVLGEQLALARALRRSALVSAGPQAARPLFRALLRSVANPGGRIAVAVWRREELPPVLELGLWAVLIVHTEGLAPLSAAQAIARHGPTRLMLGSAGGYGASDLLSVPYTLHLLEKRGLPARARRAVAIDNALDFWALG